MTTTEQPAIQRHRRGTAPSTEVIDTAQTVLTDISRIAFALVPIITDRGDSAEQAESIVADLDQLIHDIRRSVFDDAITAERFDHVDRTLRAVLTRLDDDWATELAIQQRIVHANSVIAAARLTRAAIIHLRERGMARTAEGPTPRSALIGPGVPPRTEGRTRPVPSGQYGT